MQATSFSTSAWSFLTMGAVLKPDVLEAAYACPVSVFPLPEASAICVLPRL